jgi:hypothetical protein
MAVINMLPKSITTIPQYTTLRWAFTEDNPTNWAIVVVLAPYMVLQKFRKMAHRFKARMTEIGQRRQKNLSNFGRTAA